MFVSGISSLSFTADNPRGRSSDKTRKETEIAAAGGAATGVGKVTQNTLKKMTVTTKGVNEAARYTNRVAAEAPEIVGSVAKNQDKFMKGFYEWLGNTRAMKYVEPIMHNPVVKRVVGAGAGVFALAYAGHEIGQLATSGTATYEAISELDFNMAA